MMLGLQSATLMFMISMVTLGVMVYAKDPKVVHAYVAASAITDFPHWASFAYVLGWGGLRQWTWEGPLWAQLLVPVFTFLFKIGYLGGFFGKDKVLDRGSGERKGAAGKKGL
jgi:hypothetical protein